MAGLYQLRELCGRPKLRLKRILLPISPQMKVAKQMDRTNQDVVGEKCIRNYAGELSLSDNDKMKAWVEH